MKKIFIILICLSAFSFASVKKFTIEELVRDSALVCTGTLKKVSLVKTIKDKYEYGGRKFDVEYFEGEIEVHKIYKGKEKKKTIKISWSNVIGMSGNTGRKHQIGITAVWLLEKAEDKKSYDGKKFGSFKALSHLAEVKRHLQ